MFKSDVCCNLWCLHVCWTVINSRQIHIERIMAKTIEELAIEAYPIKMVKTYGYLPGGDITEKDENLSERIAMEKGANTVLEEIETAVNTQIILLSKGDIPLANIMDGIYNKIKQLRGK